MSSSGGSGLPSKIQGIIFTEVIPKLIPEIDTAELIHLGSIVRRTNRVKLYAPLTDALRKIQWVKLMALEAISIEADISSAMEPGAVVGYPYGQLRHALTVTDALVHTKSALDSIAVFLSDFLELKAQGGNRDFKKPEFRREVASEDPILGTKMKVLDPWFQELQEVRDEWIHRSSVRSLLVIGPSECGPLPIPKKDLDLGLGAFDRAIMKQNFFSTREFVEHHYNNLVTVFRAVTRRCVEIESLSSPGLVVDPEVEKSLVFFPFRVTSDMKVTKIKSKIGPYGF